MVTYAIPPQRAVGQTGHVGDHNQIANALTVLGTQSVLNSSFAGGADPTGATDSTAALQAAFNLTSGGVFIPPGTYNYSSQLLINSSNLNVTGPAFGFAAILQYTGTSAIGSMILVGSAAKQTDVTIQNLTLKGGATTAIPYSCTSASPAVFTVGSAPANGTQVTICGSGIPGGFTAGTIYFVVGSSGSTFNLAATSGGAALNSSTTGGGVLVTGLSGHGIQWRCQGGLVQNVVVQKVVGDAFHSDPGTLATTTNDLTIINFWPEFVGGNGVFLDGSTNDSVIYAVHANGDLVPNVGGAYGINDQGNGNQMIGCHPYAFGSGGYNATGNGPQYLGGELESCGGPNATFNGVLRGRISGTLIYNAGASTGIAYTSTIAAPAVFTIAGSAPANGTNIVLNTGPGGGFAINTIYWVVNSGVGGAGNFSLAATAGGTGITGTASTGAGNLTTGPAFLQDILVNASTGVAIGDNFMRSPATLASVTVQGVSTVVKIHDNHMDNVLLPHAITLTSGGNTKFVSISDNSFNIAPSGSNGSIGFGTATSCSAIGNKQISATLFCTSASGSANNVIEGNDVTTSAGAVISLNAADTTSMVANNPGYNPVGPIGSPPAIAASGTPVTNNTNVDCMVIVTVSGSGGATSIAVGGTNTGYASSTASQVMPSVRVPKKQTITLTYTNAPTWAWWGD